MSVVVPDQRLRDLIGDELDSSDEAFIRYGRRVAAEAASAAAWQPQFDASCVTQELLALQFCLEIAGQRGEAGAPPDPVRLLEMAEALYRAEMEEATP